FLCWSRLESAGLTKRGEKVTNNMDADHGFPSRVKSDRLGMLLSDRHGCYYVIGMNVIERSPCVGICRQQ
ncbi:hypothetical protein KY227_004897, partial [Citrobacter freundii]